MKWVLRLVALGCALYVIAVVALVVLQRRLMYFPSPNKGDASAWNLPKAQTLRLVPADGQSIVAWYQPAQSGHRLYLYFHGNGGELSDRAGVLRELAADGSGFLAIDYEGYGGSTGSPTEAGLFADGDATYAKAIAEGYAPADIVIVGESLGTAVAISVAAGHPSKALVLDSAFASAVDIAASEYPMFPVHFLMSDKYESITRIAAVTAPKLFLHGGRDPVIPEASDRRLFDRAREPKTFMVFPDLGHVVLLAPGTVAKVQAWLAALPPARPAPVAGRD